MFSNILYPSDFRSPSDIKVTFYKSYVSPIVKIVGCKQNTNILAKICISKGVGVGSVGIWQNCNPLCASNPQNNCFKYTNLQNEADDITTDQIWRYEYHRSKVIKKESEIKP